MLRFCYFWTRIQTSSSRRQYLMPYFRMSSPNNIISCFKACGLFPLNPEAIPETVFAQSILREVPVQLESDATDKEPILPSNPPRPLTSERFPEASDSSNIIPGNLKRLHSSTPTSAVNVQLNETQAKLAIRVSHHTVTSDSNNDDYYNDVPLSQLQAKTSLQQLMQTPIKTNETSAIIRAKAINYSGKPVPKELFDGNNKNEKSVKSDVRIAIVQWWNQGGIAMAVGWTGWLICQSALVAESGITRSASD
ncbi:hypothetical protein PR048_033116 [Dryococelus australis]|uniref:Uncharacterized protein n=1 Tax=Dryococelus australis TaxID=614101 RepID=A0ABQ9FZB6_9NEOP|nr:hypothetical protein PR048_033116 [Dryococelus australis]